jgi:tRNA nucleotidyltransferase (CCA-adding enzyme)
MLGRVSGERIRHELYLILREREPERVLCRLDELDVLSQIHPEFACGEGTQAQFGKLRHAIASGEWDVPFEENGLPTPGLYLALMTYGLSRPDLEAVANRLKIYRHDLTLLNQVLELRERETDLDRPDLSNQEIDAMLRNLSTAAVLIVWLRTSSDRVRERLSHYETKLRHIQPVVDGEYLKSLGLKPSPLFSKLLWAVRSARLDGEIETVEEEKDLIAHLLAERDRASP